MISTSGASPVRSAHREPRRARSRAPASRRSPGTEPEPAAAGAEHRVRLVQLLRCGARMRPRSTSSSAGRNSCSGGSSSRIVTGKPGHRLEDALEVAPAASAAAARARPAGRPRRRGEDHLPHSASRSGAMNMCSVRQRPIPSAPNSRALRGVLRRVGVGPHPQPPAPRPPSPATVRSRRSPRRTSSHRAEHDLARGPSIVIGRRSRDDLLADRTVPALRRSGGLAAGTQGLPMPRATTAACEVMPPCAVRMPWPRPCRGCRRGWSLPRTRITVARPVLGRAPRPCPRRDDLARRGPR